MYADVPATNVLAPDRIRVLAALGDSTIISRLLVAKTAVLWVFVAPLCAVLALVVALDHHDPLLIGAEIIAICVVPVACLPVAALVGIRWPYHPLQLGYRWDHRVPLRRMIVRWLILAAVPYALVPALCLLMTVPAVILLVLTHSANNHVISLVDAEGKPFGLALSGPSHPLSGGIFAARPLVPRGGEALTRRPARCHRPRPGFVAGRVAPPPRALVCRRPEMRGRRASAR